MVSVFTFAKFCRTPITVSLLTFILRLNVLSCVFPWYRFFTRLPETVINLALFLISLYILTIISFAGLLLCHFPCTVKNFVPMSLVILLVTSLKTAFVRLTIYFLVSLDLFTIVQILLMSTMLDFFPMFFVILSTTRIVTSFALTIQSLLTTIKKLRSRGEELLTFTSALFAGCVVLGYSVIHSKNSNSCYHAMGSSSYAVASHYFPYYTINPHIKLA